MRIYQVLVLGSFVALAACNGADTSDGVAAPANDVSAAPGAVGETSATLPRGEGDATSDEEPNANRPEGAVDPLRPPPTQ